MLSCAVLSLAFASVPASAGEAVDDNAPPTAVQEFFYVGHNLKTPRQGGRIADFQVCAAALRQHRAGLIPLGVELR